MVDYHVYGVSTRIQGPQSVVDEVHRHRPLCWVPLTTPAETHQPGLLFDVAGDATGYRIERDADEVVAEGLDDPAAAAHALLGDAHFEIACRSRRFLFIHAGVVGVNGGALLIPGRTHAGKSTLVAELVGQGASYLSDEYAVIGPDLLIHPYARELAIRDEHGRVTPTPVADLGGSAAVEPIPARWILWSRYVKESSWSPQQVRGSRTVVPLFDNAVLAQDEGAELLDRLSKLMPGVVVWEGDRPEAAVAVSWLLARLGLQNTR